MSIADRIIEKCGGVPETARLAGTTENWVYRWRLPRERGGTDGQVPRRAQENLLAAAARGEVRVTPADFFEQAAE